MLILVTSLLERPWDSMRRVVLMGLGPEGLGTLLLLFWGLPLELVGSLRAAAAAT